AEHKIPNSTIRQLGIETSGFVAHPKMDDSGHSVTAGYTTQSDGTQIGHGLWAMNYDLSKVVAIGDSFSRAGLYPSISDSGPKPKEPETTTVTSFLGKNQTTLSSGSIVVDGNPATKTCPDDKKED